MTTSDAACWAGAASIAAASIAVHASAGAPPHREAAASLERFLARPAVVHEYRAQRRLEASGGGQRGWLEGDISFTIASGLQYDVTGEGGSGYIRSRVLRSLLDEERRVIAEGRTGSVALTQANYTFFPETLDDAGLAIVRIEPRRKERSLIKGRVFLTADEGHPVRIEGVLAKSPSFWIARTSVVRSYGPIDGAFMPLLLDTNGQLRLFGSSALRMTYRYLEIDNRAVLEESEDPHP